MHATSGAQLQPSRRSSSATAPVLAGEPPKAAHLSPSRALSHPSFLLRFFSLSQVSLSLSTGSTTPWRELGLKVPSPSSSAAAAPPVAKRQLPSSLRPPHGARSLLDLEHASPCPLQQRAASNPAPPYRRPPEIDAVDHQQETGAHGRAPRAPPHRTSSCRRIRLGNGGIRPSPTFRRPCLRGTWDPAISVAPCKPRRRGCLLHLMSFESVWECEDPFDYVPFVYFTDAFIFQAGSQAR